ncbi:unnamed protein product [Urochloa humidicola]
MVKPIKSWKVPIKCLSCSSLEKEVSKLKIIPMFRKLRCQVPFISMMFWNESYIMYQSGTLIQGTKD